MKVAFTKEPDFYIFSNKHKSEYIFFGYGLIVSNTSEETDIEIYNYKKDKIENGKGYIRTSFFYKLVWKYPFFKKDSVLTQTILK